MRQEFVSWFSEGHKFQYLCCCLDLVGHVSETVLRLRQYPLHLVCHASEKVSQIKQCTTNCHVPHFLTDQTNL